MYLGQLLDIQVPPVPIQPKSAGRTPIIEAALGFSALPRPSPAHHRAAWNRSDPAMKPIVLSPTRSRPLNLFLGLVVLLVSLLLFLALATYHPTDPSLNTATAASADHAARNWIGLFGAWLSDLLFQSIGITAFLLPAWLGALGWGWMRSRPGGSIWLRWVGTLLALAFVPTVFALLPWHWRWLHVLPVEGVVGLLMAGMLVGYMNLQGAWLVAGVLSLAGIYFSSAVSLWALKEGLVDRWIHFQSLRDRWRNWREERAMAKADLELASAPEPGDEPEEFAEPRPSLWARLFRRRQMEAEPEPDPIDEIPAFQRTAAQPREEAIPIAPPVRRSIWERSAEETTPSPAPPGHGPVAAPAPRTAAMEARVEAARAAESRIPESRAAELRPSNQAATPLRQDPPLAALQPAGQIAIHDRADAAVRMATVAPKAVSGFKLPPSTLLNAGEGPQAVREDALREEAKVLVEKCGEFDVRGQVVQINPGPMVTTYEFKPEAGVKYSRVTGLADDLCLAMRAESILIERMAGKSTVGIQVPNHERETIHLRDVLESETFAKSKSKLTMAMGKDINGRIVTADLASMPHVLIAGSTGSGKSVAINAMIMSLLFRTTPAQVRLILVDPKRVELGMYEGVPHLFTPIITEPKLAANALRNAVREMERRLKLLASRSVRNIDQYNKLFEGTMASLFDNEDEQPLPCIVIIIDELADLMMLDRANVEESITRLAQMARAVGIHLILATQRPSVDVITGLIKANVPTRISFRLATKVDSRTILDTNGAEALLGRGDMLFLPPGTSRLMRLHAPYVSEKETAAVVDFWKAQGQAEYVEGFLESPKDERVQIEGSNDDPDENDPMFDDAVRLVFEFGKASTSLLQRRLRIGYGRAAHLIDLMERDGLVGPADGSRPRELLKAPGWLHEVAMSNEMD
jgi:DNA segregation ATPase FtsK/SpoIIIE, S-DNA-T family